MALAISEEPTAHLSNLQPLWHRSAPRRLVEKCPADDPLRGWTVWQKHLAGRKARPVPPLVCKMSRDELFAAAQHQPIAAQQIDLPEALDALALAYALPDLARDLSGEAWWRLVERLHDLATAARVDRIAWPGDPRAVLRAQIVAGELPLALGYMLPEIRALRGLNKMAHSMLSESLLELTDGCGLPHARLLPVLEPLFECWTRIRWLGDRIKGGCWSADADVQYVWLVQHALRLVDANGQFMLVPRDEEPTKPWPKKLFATAIELVGDREHRAAAAAALPTRVTSRGVRCNKHDVPAATLESDWAGIAVLAEGWARSHARLALAFADDPIRVELAIGRNKLLAGDWTNETTCDGVPARIIGEWEQSAWETGKRFAYMELGVDMSDGLRLERQLLFAHDDQVLFVADTVLSSAEAPSNLRHEVRLPLAQGVEWRPERDTRDGVLEVGNRRVAVLPLDLHEWRCDPRGGSLTEESRQLILTEETTGRALYCPLLIDLKPRRARQERTWRQLTVAESLEAVPRDQAVGFRAQSGRDQWVFYRSLGLLGNRTLLGYNISSEFAAGRFLTTGEVKEWLEVESV
jgi:hypothetical protein